VCNSFICQLTDDLDININRTKYMYENMWNQNQRQGHNVTASNKSFTNASHFKYPETVTATAANVADDEIMRKIK
jgi:hypothetical protein